MSSISGRCACGEVSWQSDADVLWSAICHCEDCRRAASADQVSWLGLPREEVQWTGERKFHKSSAGVQRGFCPACGSHVSFESDAFPQEVHLYAVTLDDLERYRPTAHIFWPRKVPWFTLGQDIACFDRGLPDAASRGEDQTG